MRPIASSLYEAFPAVEARRLVERFEWHYTPKHGSWLNLAETELGVLTSQCLDRRIPNKQILIDENRRLGARPQCQPEIAPEPTGHGLPLSKCEAYNRVYEQSCGSS